MSKEQGSESAVSGSQFIKEEKVAEEKEAPKKVSRKDFVKGAAAVAGAGALASCAPAATPAPTTAPGETAGPTPWIPEKWDYEADVVIVGYGGAGAVTAIVAHDAGAKVLILEAAPEGRHGGTTRVSGNIYIAPPPGMEEEEYEYLKNQDYGDQVEDEILRTVAAEMMEVEGWIGSLGGEPVEIPYPPVFNVPGSEACRRMVVGQEGMGNSHLWNLYEENVRERGIEVLYASPAGSLVATPEREVLGVVAEGAQGELHIKALRAVVLATGGFSANQEMLKDYAPGWPLFYWGCPYNTGAGYLMAQALGAELSAMNNIRAPQRASLKVPDFDAVFPIAMPGNSFVFVNKFGERFMNEVKTNVYSWGWREIIEFDFDRLTFPQIPWYAIFDQALMDAGPIQPWNFMGWNAIVEGYEWSSDNQAELAKGWILKADTLEEVADKIAGLDGNEGKMDAATLKATMEAYDKACRDGMDPCLGRPADKLIAVSGPPYYFVELWPLVHATQGGPKRDADARIIDVFGDVIPRLYSAGEMGSWWGSGYDGGVIEAIPSGRIAGRKAAAEEPWG